MTCLTLLENQSVSSNTNSSTFSTPTSTEDANNHKSTSNSETEEMIGKQYKDSFLYLRE